MTTLLDDIQRSRDRSESSLLQGLTEEAILTLAEDVNAMDSILTMARSQETIANDILSLARIQQSTLQVYPVDSKIVQEAKNIVSLFRSEWCDRGRACVFALISVLTFIFPDLQSDEVDQPLLLAWTSPSAPRRSRPDRFQDRSSAVLPASYEPHNQRRSLHISVTGSDN